VILGTIKTRRRTNTSFLIECPMGIMKLLQSEIHGKPFKTFKTATNNEEIKFKRNKFKKNSSVKEH